jgi:hypothetical protein
MGIAFGDYRQPVALLYLLRSSGFTGLMPCINPDPV